MAASNHRAFARYGAAVAIVALATLVRLLLDAYLGDTVPHISYFVAVALAGWYGGLGPSLLALVLGAAVADYLFIPPRHSFVPTRKEDYLGLGLYLGLGTAIALLFESSRAAHRRAERQAEWLRVTLASIGEAVIATDRQGRVSFLNGVAESLTGWRQGEAIGQPLEAVFKIISERTRQPAENPVARILREGIVVGLANHTALVAKDGTEHSITDTAAPIRDFSGKIGGFVLVFRDVTEQRRAEEASLRLAAIVESSDDAIVGKDLDGIITSWNGGAERIFGYAAEEIVGRPASDLMPPDHAEDFPRILERIRRGERVEHYQTKRRRRDGRVIDVSLTVSPIRDAGGGIVGASKIARDITDRIRQAEELQRAKDLAEAANRAKDDFIAALSHELRTPLTPVLMTVSDLEADARVPAELRDDIRTMRRNVEMEARLIDDLLDLTRIAQGKLDLKKEAVDAHRLIREAVGICKADVEAKRLTLTLDLRARRHRVRGDGARLQQVVWNLAKNATKFTPPGGAITITTEDADGDRLAIRVADTGIGIAPEVLPRIFDAFEQGGRETTKKFGGLGLGLAISKALVEAHGGTLAAFSGGQGEGATFTVQLRGAEDPTGAGREPADGDGEARRRDLRILLVDDHKDTLHVLSRTLKKAGHDVTTAEDLATALEASAARPFDLLVSDLGLPDGTGLDLMRRLTPLPGIALTGYGMEADIEKCREAGFVAHLTKPIDPKRLEAEIQRLAVAIRPMRATTP